MSELKKTTTYAGAAIVLAVLALLTAPRASVPDAFADRGEAFFPDFEDPNLATTLEVIEFDEETAAAEPFKVTFEGGRWTIPSHHGYPADGADRLAQTAAGVIGITKEYRMDGMPGEIETLWAQGAEMLKDAGAVLRDITLPALSLSILFISADSRFGRASMLETLNQDYIRTARAKGLSERTVVWKHALRNALIPLVTLWALNFSALMGGSIVTESVFSWPGIGQVFLRALPDADVSLVLAIVLFTGLLVVIMNLVADVMYGVLDPRIRLD